MNMQSLVLKLHQLDTALAESTVTALTPVADAEQLQELPELLLTLGWQFSSGQQLAQGDQRWLLFHNSSLIPGSHTLLIVISADLSWHWELHPGHQTVQQLRSSTGPEVTADLPAEPVGTDLPSLQRAISVLRKSSSAPAPGPGNLTEQVQYWQQQMQRPLAGDQMLVHINQTLVAECTVLHSDESGNVLLENAELWHMLQLNQLSEAEYQGRKVQLNQPRPGDVKKYQVFVRDPKTGRVKKVNFGDPDMRIRRDDAERRRNFRARHRCSTARDRTTARYWSCRFWSNTPVSQLLGKK